MRLGNERSAGPGGIEGRGEGCAGENTEKAIQRLGLPFPNSEVLIHQPLGGTQGQASDILNYAESIRRTREQLNTILSRNTDKPIETIRIDTDRDNRMTAYEARAYGLVDTVIEVTPKAYDIKKYETV